MRTDALLRFYGRLSSRSVDLIGDFAGQELFLVDGDSLLLHLFSDPALDFDNGLQLLHLVYALETFLQHLLDRRANFDIVWYQSNKNLSIPRSKKENAYKYIFARQVVISHLDHYLQNENSPIKIHKFASPVSSAAKAFYASSGTYFIMCHDGADGETAKTGLLKSIQYQKAGYRAMIRQFIVSGMSVALVNEVSFRDTKVITQVVEGLRSGSIKPTEQKKSVSATAAESDDGEDDAPQEISSSSSEPDSDSEDEESSESEDEGDFTLDASESEGAPKSAAEEIENLTKKLQKLASETKLTDAVTQRLLLLSSAVKAVVQASNSAGPLSSAALLHLVLMQSIPLSQRRLPDIDGKNLDANKSTAFTQALLANISRVLRDDYDKIESLPCDIADVVDGRLLLHVVQHHAKVKLASSWQKFYAKLCGIVGVQPLQCEISDSPPNAVLPEKEQDDENAVLPFTNECFDTHLESIKLSIARREPKESPETARIFEDLTHWHNARKPLNKRAALIAQPDLSGRALMKAQRRNQNRLAEMSTYAASLTNAVGKSLDPEIIAVDTSTKADTGRQKQLDMRPKTGKPPAKDSQTKKKMTPQQSQKLALFEKENAKKQTKQDQVQVQLFQAWKQTKGMLESIKDGQKRYLAAEKYLSGLPTEKRVQVQAEVRLYGILSLLTALSARKDELDHTTAMNALALVASLLQGLKDLPVLTDAEAIAANKLAKGINMPLTLSSSGDVRRPLSFDVTTPKHVPTIGLDWKEFQLLHFGPFMDRNIDAADDDRVPFKPDAWQRDVLDAVDRDNSVFVVAPTSAGKTFISFYAMRKVLASGDDNVLVYLAPTKALVNQIAAEVQARFTKTYKHAGNSVWAIHTRDHRINNPSGCQILVTVPHVLQIMLLAPENAKTWAPRVKRIIFDEIHCIGQADDGLVWEQLLLLSPCPIIALSATVGNSEEFTSWMSSTQEALGNELVKIEHKHRYSDLRKFIYRPPTKWAFQGLPTPKSSTQIGIENPDFFSFVHPVAGLINRSRSMPEDLSLEARDCLTLYQAMVKVQTKEFSVPKDLDPATLPAHIIKADVLKWEARLKVLLRKWLADWSSPFDELIKQLNRTSENANRPAELIASPDETLAASKTAVKFKKLPPAVDGTTVQTTTLPLLVSLEQQNALPAILFNYDRSQCEDICQHVLKKLKRAEDEWKKTSPAWTKKLARFETFKKNKEAAAKKASKLGKKSKNDPEEGMSKMDRAMMEGAEDISEFDSFDPEAPQDGFTFADKKKLTASELEGYVDRLERRQVSPWLIQALSRGLGVHHAGMNRIYRQIVEILFRQGFLRVIIATGTLALGINMPCKTVVFSGDSVFLTALNYRQAAGRAGRRGFDLIGNVVFHGLSNDKVYRLLSSRLPDLNGHFPITTTLVLRLFSLLHNSDKAPYARQAVKALLSQPRIYLGAAAFKQQVLHHLRFSIDYLRRQGLLAANGAPVNFAGTITHLYYTENSGFAFHVLLKSGYFHTLARRFQENADDAKDKLMLVMSHLFGRQVCKISDQEFERRNLKMSSSAVFLPDIPPAAKTILEAHNENTRRVFTAYVRTFANQHLEDTTQDLPLSKLKFEGSDEQSSISHLPAPIVRSAFVALSGHGDDFESVSDLCGTVRSGVFLEKAVVPHLDIYPDAAGRRLNAYLYDYFRNEDVRALDQDNGIRRADVWFMLNDFSLVLATITASLAGYLRAYAVSELDMLDIKGGGDVAADAKDDELIPGQETAEETKERLARAKNVATEVQVKPKKKKVADSWEEEAGQDESESEAEDEFEGSTAAGTFGETASTATALNDEIGLKGVLRMFEGLQLDFNTKFRAMWA